MSDVADLADLADLAVLEAAETKGERTRRRILEIAIERFGRRGYRATSVSEIARAAGLTQAASYAYFDSKEALFRAAVDEDASAMIDEIGVRTADLPAKDLIPSLIIFAVLVLGEHPLAHRVLAGQEPDEVPRLVELPALRRFGDMIGDHLAIAQQRGEVRPDFDARVLSSGIEALVLGLLFSTIQTGGVAAERHQIGVVEAFDLMIRPAR